jgi:serine/threonine-protein kinase
MAEVYLASQHSAAGVDRFVAVKRILPHLAVQERFVTMFLDEARLAAKLTHQNIAQVIDFGAVEGEYFLAMEYLVGQTLNAVMQQVLAKGQRVPLGIALSIIGQICDGLHFAHTFAEGGAPLNIVHRDMSLSNVFLTFQGGVKIIDFGIAHAALRLQESTRTGVFKGKAAYSSPEQLEGLPLDGRSDVFSVGVMLHALLTGARLFRRDTQLATMQAVISDPAPSVREVRPELPATLDAILAHALAKHRDERYASAQALRRDLDALVVTSPVRLDDWLEALYGRAVIAQATDLGAQRAHVARTEQVPAVEVAHEGPTRLPASTVRADAVPAATIRVDALRGGDPRPSRGPASNGASAPQPARVSRSNGAATAQPPPASDPRPARVSRSNGAAAAQPELSAPALTDEAAVAALRRRSPVALGALGLLGLALLVGAAATLKGAPIAAEPPAPVAPVPIAPPVPRPAAVERVTLTFTSTPDRVEVYEGDALLGVTPLRLGRAEDAEATLRFSLKGYREQTRKVRFSTSTEIPIQLERAPAVARPGRGSSSVDDLKPAPF